MRIAQRVTFCGILCAAATVVLLLSVVPLSTFMLPIVAGAVFIAPALELGTRYGVLCYVVTALLAAVLTPDIESKVLFIAFFGYYPLLQLRLVHVANAVLAWGIKLIVFNVAVIAAYLLMLRVLGLQEAALTIGDVYLPGVFLLLGNAVFVLYDIALTRFAQVYRIRLHPFIRKIVK